MSYGPAKQGKGERDTEFGQPNSCNGINIHSVIPYCEQDLMNWQYDTNGT